MEAWTPAPSSARPVTPREVATSAIGRAYGPGTRASEIVTWLRQDYRVGRGHLMALVHILKHGAVISDSPSAVLHLDGGRSEPQREPGTPRRNRQSIGGTLSKSIGATGRGTMRFGLPGRHRGRLR